MDEYPLWAWLGFGIFISAMLALDLGVFNRKAHVVSVKEAATWCIVWFSLAMGFNAFVWHEHGSQAAAQWFASYLVELGLSVDNVFVFIVVFSFFKVRAEYQHRVLFWGIIGAAVMRAVFILVGVKLIEHFEWVLMIFGVFLIFTGIKLALPKKDEHVHPEKNVVVRLFRKFFPVAPDYHEGRFFTKIDGRKVATPLFIVLLVIETTDVVFALDSIPAVLGITKVPFIAFTSNIFAILGLRSMYFALSGVMGMFRFLGIGLAVILVFIGMKMIVGYIFEYHVSIGLSLGVIGGTLALSVIASLLFPGKKKTESQ
ncbi:tellurite resistance protein TerC [Ereboglobus sp. PH5-10]|nr:TerC family protein [Ereboglobus sp. PH5-10]MDF9827621.1 tellurite resistance protein TerC [Ereboglobus sp. PH5-10]